MKVGSCAGELRIGDEASFSKTISETDVYLYAGIGGDFNPMHVNEEYAKITPFKRRIAHGGVTISLLAHVLGLDLPGLGTLVNEMTVRFLAPAFIGDTITARAKVAEIDVAKNKAVMALYCTNQNGVVLIEGTALVSPPPEGLKRKVAALESQSAP